MSIATQTQTAEAVDALWLAFEADRSNKDIRNQLVMHYAGLVRGIVHGVLGGQQSYKHLEDATSEGLIALIDAVERFDATKAAQFKTYASIRVRGAVIDYFRRMDPFPRRVRSLARLLQEKQDALSTQLGHTPGDAQMAEAMGVGLPEYRQMLSETAALNILSFEELLYEKGMDTLSGTQDSPYEALERDELRGFLTKAVEALGEQERVVISLYYLEGLKIKEIAEVLEVGASRVSQVHSAALLKLRRALADF